MNIFSSHPLITNSQQYVFQKKFISIHSEDRDILKYPISSSFEIELPQDYLNVQSVKLSSWSFPSNYYVFSQEKYNTFFVFSITDPYNPYINNNQNSLQQAIFSGFNSHILDQFICFIQEGSYTPKQLANELTNKMNYCISKYLITYLTEFFPALLQSFYDEGLYSDFVVVYNEVSMKLWFGNKNSGFKINNDSLLYSNCKLTKNPDCYNTRTINKYINWGLPWFLGFTYCNYESEIPEESIYDANGNIIYLNLPRFNYGDALNNGDNGYWLLPTLTGANVYFIETPEKINITGLEYFYMQINGLNNIDTTIPFNISNFTDTTNQTNGVVNNAFAKIPINSFPLNQCFDDSQFPHKYFNPPAERIRKLFINLTYHDGMPVFFGNSDFSFTLELGLLTPQNKLDYDLVVPECTKYFS
jgi:hypothetical protein